MSLLDKMKQEINRAGGSKGKILYVKKDSKRRVRFLWELDRGLELPFHDSFVKSVNSLCLEKLGKNCPYCDSKELRHRNLFAWPVWDYDAKEIKIFLYPVNNCSPLPNLISFYETYKTILDRDYVIERKGEGTSTTYPVIPMDKSKFRNNKLKVPTEKAIIKVVSKAFPVDESVELDDFEVVEKEDLGDISDMEDGGFDYDDEDDHPFGDDMEDEENLEEMSPKELYLYCIKNDIEVPKKKTKKYYLKKIKEHESEEDEWGEEENDEW